MSEVIATYGMHLHTLQVAVSRKLRADNWPRERIEKVLTEIAEAPNYEAADTELAG